MEIEGKKYLSEEEASKRYGYSRSWFSLHRKMCDGPKCVRLKHSNNKAWYPLDETDCWFKSNLIDGV